MRRAPASRARAADEGLMRPFAAFAYFSKGTWSDSEAPIALQTAFTHSYTERDRSRSRWTASRIARMSSSCTHR